MQLTPNEARALVAAVNVGCNAIGVAETAKRAGVNEETLRGLCASMTNYAEHNVDAATPRETLDDMLADTKIFFEEIIKGKIPSKPELLPRDRFDWARTAFQEEMTEFELAQAVGDVEGAADALVDLGYFVLGRLIEMGIPPGPAWREVHRANMEKQRAKLAKRGDHEMDAGKPAGWNPPDHSWMLRVELAHIRSAITLSSFGGPPAVDLPEPERLVPRALPPLGGKTGVAAEPGRAMKHTESKPDLSLIPYYAQEVEALAFMFGEQKYSRWNHTHGLPFSKTIASIMRHIGQFNNGEDLDVGPGGSGLPHLAHIRCDCAMLLEWTKTHPELDDRRHVHKTGNKTVGPRHA